MARRQVKPNVCSQLVEQTVRISAVVLGLGYTADSPLEVRCAVVMGCTALSEGISAGIMLLFYRREVRRYFKGAACRCAQAARPAHLGDLVAGRGRKVPCQRLAYSGKYAGACLFGRISGGGQVGAVQRWRSTRQLKGVALPLLTFPLWAAGQFVGAADARDHPGAAPGRAGPPGCAAGSDAAAHGVFFRFGGGAVLGVGAYRWRRGCMAAEKQVSTCVSWPAMPLDVPGKYGGWSHEGTGEQKAVFRYSVWDSILRIAGVALLLPRFG